MRGRRPFSISETHGMLALPSVTIKACSEGKNWTSLFTSVQKELPFQGVFKSSSDHLLVLHRNGPVQLNSKYNHRGGPRVVPAGGVHIISPGAEFAIDLAGPVETVHVYIRRSVIEEVALDMIEGDPADLNIPNAIIDEDQALRVLIEASAFALEDDAQGTSMFADYLSQTLAAQLIRTYSNAKIKSNARITGSSGLSYATTKALEYMEANIGSTITIVDIAEATHCSQSHLSRVFRNEMGVPPHHYLMTLRINKARQLLAKSNTAIAEIALDCGFSHQEYLTRLFGRFCGTTPAAYRRSRRN